MSASTFHCWNVSSGRIGKEREEEESLTHLSYGCTLYQPVGYTTQELSEKGLAWVNGYSRNVFYIPQSFIKKKKKMSIRSFVFKFIHSFKHFVSPLFLHSGGWQSLPSAVWGWRWHHTRETLPVCFSPRTHLSCAKVVLHILLILFTQLQCFFWKESQKMSLSIEHEVEAELVQVPWWLSACSDVCNIELNVKI